LAYQAIYSGSFVPLKTIEKGLRFLEIYNQIGDMMENKIINLGIEGGLAAR
jgi:hypothetical protein